MAWPGLRFALIPPAVRQFSANGGCLLSCQPFRGWSIIAKAIGKGKAGDVASESATGIPIGELLSYC